MQPSCLLYLPVRDLYLTHTGCSVSGTLPKFFPAPGPLCIRLLPGLPFALAFSMGGFILTFGSIFNVTLKMNFFFSCYQQLVIPVLS